MFRYKMALLSAVDAALRGDVSAQADQLRGSYRPQDDPGALAVQEMADSICLAPPDQLIDPAETEAYRQALLASFGD